MDKVDKNDEDSPVYPEGTFTSFIAQELLETPFKDCV